MDLVQPSTSSAGVAVVDETELQMPEEVHEPHRCFFQCSTYVYLVPYHLAVLNEQSTVLCQCKDDAHICLAVVPSGIDVPDTLYLLRSA